MLNVIRNEASKTLKLSILFNKQNHNVCKSQELPQIKHAHSSLSHLLKKSSSKADVYCVWFAVTMVYRNMQVATTTILCIQLREGMS